MFSVRKSIKFSKGELSYLVLGEGPRKTLVFHGFGQSAEEFSQYVKNINGEFTFYLFDHFFHGESEWHNDGIITSEDFRDLLNVFFLQEVVHRFSVIAYSLGGKWAHSVVRFFPEKVKKVFLCAPDGSKTTFYYSFSSRNPLGRWIFKRTVNNSVFFFWLLRSLFQVGVLNKTLYRFVYFQMGTARQREQVYNTWTRYRHFKGLSQSTISIYNTHQIPLKILLGSYDRVIQPVWFDSFRTKLKTLEIDIVTKGHRSILTSIAPRAKDFLE